MDRHERTWLAHYHTVGVHRYTRIHLESGARSTGQLENMGRAGALEMVNRWNGQQSGVWLYVLEGA